MAPRVVAGDYEVEFEFIEGERTLVPEGDSHFLGFFELSIPYICKRTTFVDAEGVFGVLLASWGLADDLGDQNLKVVVVNLEWFVGDWREGSLAHGSNK